MKKHDWLIVYNGETFILAHELGGDHMNMYEIVLTKEQAFDLASREVRTGPKAAKLLFPNAEKA